MVCNVDMQSVQIIRNNAIKKGGNAAKFGRMISTKIVPDNLRKTEKSCSISYNNRNNADIKIYYNYKDGNLTSTAEFTELENKVANKYGLMNMINDNGEIGLLFNSDISWALPSGCKAIHYGSNSIVKNLSVEQSQELFRNIRKRWVV